MTSRRNLVTVVGYAVLSFALIAGLWYVVIWVFNLKPFVMPTPVASVRALWDARSTLAQDASITVKETMLGFGAGATFGFISAVLMAQSRHLQRLFYPPLITSQAVPVVAIAPPLVILLGFGLTSKIVIVAWIVFFPVLVSVLDGLVSIDRDMFNLARIMNGSKGRTFFVIKLPAAIGPMFSGLKIGATYAVTGAVIGEWTASTGQGLGPYIQSADAALDTAAVYGATMLLTALGVSGFLCVLGLERLATPWKYRGTARKLSIRRSDDVRSSSLDRRVHREAGVM
ncbi:MAG: ABC transporter permease [Actinomycetes bacterium]